MRTTLCLLLALLPVSAVRGQRDAKIPDPDPEIERKSFKVADGFEVNLFAADPLLFLSQVEIPVRRFRPCDRQHERFPVCRIGKQRRSLS